MSDKSYKVMSIELPDLSKCPKLCPVFLRLDPDYYLKKGKFQKHKRLLLIPSSVKVYKDRLGNQGVSVHFSRSFLAGNGLIMIKYKSFLKL